MIVTKYSDKFRDLRSVQIDTDTNKFNMSVWKNPSMWEPINNHVEYLDKEYNFYSKSDCILSLLDLLAKEKARISADEEFLKKEFIKENIKNDQIFIK